MLRVEFKDKILTEIVEQGNQFFKSLKACGIMSERNFSILHKNRKNN